MTRSPASSRSSRADRQAEDRQEGSESEGEDRLQRLTPSERQLLTEALVTLLEEEAAEQSWLSALRSPLDSEAEEEEDDDAL